MGMTGVTQFDLAVLALLAISGVVGFFRGAVREIVALVALVGAGALAIIALPRLTPLIQRFIHTEWLALAATLIVTFVITYALVRLVGGLIAGHVRKQSFLGILDRSLGLFIGLARGLLVLGALNLMFNAATPQDLRPQWIVGATTWPLAQNMGRLLVALAPQGLDLASELKPAFDRAVGNAVDDRLKTEGYDATQRGEIDDLVEKSR